MWENSNTIENWPGGGGFSITKYSLDGLYEQHQLDRNWWTITNYNSPLVRYINCKLKLYQSYDVDYCVNYHLEFPMLATMLLYQASQPSFLMMSKNTVFIPSRKTQPWKKPYKTLHIRPPHQMSNKWFFARDLCKTGLLLLQAAACSFDQYYINSNNITSTVRFITLDPYLFQRHDFIQPPISGGYTPLTEGTIEKHLWATQIQWQASMKYKPKDIILLGNSKDYQQGQTVSNQNKQNYLTEHQYWGNPFHHHYFIQDNMHLLVSIKPLSQWAEEFQTPDKEFKEIYFTQPSNPTNRKCAYTPWKDTGQNNKIYLLSVGRDTNNWDPPQDDSLISEGFPLWASLFGFIDWQIQTKSSIQVHRNYVLVIQSQFITPQLPYYIPLDEPFLEGVSPYWPLDSGHITDTDNKSWYPCVMYQLQTISAIVNSGPGTPKIDKTKSVQAKLKYQFTFKFGGHAPKMDSITDPSKQEVYPIPNCQPPTYSLQSPSLSPEMFLYQFDAPKDILTKKATKRIKTSEQTPTTLFTGSAMHPDIQMETGSSESEEEKETTQIYFELKRQRKLRKYYQQQLEALTSQP